MTIPEQLADLILAMDRPRPVRVGIEVGIDGATIAGDLTAVLRGRGRAVRRVTLDRAALLGAGEAGAVLLAEGALPSTLDDIWDLRVHVDTDHGGAGRAAAHDRADVVVDARDPDNPVLADVRERLLHNAGNAATGGIWRVRRQGGTAILKVARPPAADGRPVGSPAWQTSDEPTHWNYWRREALAYTSGLAATAYADAGIAGPALLDAEERPDGSVALWLADATGEPGIRWPVARLGRFAYQLGVGQARHAGRVPDTPWLSRGWLAQFLRGRDIWVPDEPDWTHPLAAIWPDDVKRRLSALWRGREAALAHAGTVPRTLCHLDVWPMNLIEATRSETVLLDWAFVGEGGLGEDPANLIMDSVTDGFIDAALLPDIVDAVTGGYVDGLRDGGWTGPPDLVRFGIAAAAVTKWCWFGPALLGRAIRDGRVGSTNYGTGAPVEAELLRLRGHVTLIADWAEAVLG